jgi:hypothetical protein
MGRKTNFSVKLSLDAADYLKNLVRVQTVTAGAVSGISRGFKFLAATFVSAAALRGMASMTKSTMDSVVAIDRLSQSTGLAADDLMVYAKASEYLGATSLNLSKAINQEQRSVIEAIKGSRDLRRAFSDLGITTEWLASATEPERFERIVVALGDIESESMRATLAYKIFGREAENLNELMVGGREGFAKARAELERTGASFDRIDLAAIRVASQAVADMGDAWGVFKQKVTIALTPLIYTLSKTVESILLDPQKVKEFAEVIESGVKQSIRWIQLIPQNFGIAWREVMVQVLEFKRLFEGGLIPGLDTPQMREIDERLTVLKSELAALREEKAKLDEQLNNEGFFEALKEQLKDIGTVSGGGLKPISAAMERLKRDLEGVQMTIEDGLSEALADLFVEGKAGFRDLARVILKELVTALVRAQVVTPLLNMMGLGAGGGTLGGMFGGFRANGGDVQAGRAYVVGERKPELFVPNTAGRILPDAAAATGAGRMRGGDTYHIDARGADPGAIARLEQMILALNGSIENRSVAAVYDATRRGRLGFA